jgi:hypothetical protein
LIFNVPPVDAPPDKPAPPAAEIDTPVPVTIVVPPVPVPEPPPAPTVIAKTCPAVTEAIKIAVLPAPPPFAPDPEPPLLPPPPPPVAVIFNFVVPVGTVKLNVPVPVFTSGVPVVFVAVFGRIATDILVKPPPIMPPVAAKLPVIFTLPPTDKFPTTALSPAMLVPVVPLITVVISYLT